MRSRGFQTQRNSSAICEVACSQSFSGIRQIAVGRRARPAAIVEGLSIVRIDFESLARVGNGEVEVRIWAVYVSLRFTQASANFGFSRIAVP